MDVRIIDGYMARAAAATSVRELHATVRALRGAHPADPDADRVERACWERALGLLTRPAVRRADAGEAVAVCTLVRTRGSTPQKPGAVMVVLRDGKTLGTIGGGCVEAEVRTRALSVCAKLFTPMAFLMMGTIKACVRRDIEQIKAGIEGAAAPA